jgi:formylglycine-generating enzyme required for sulfatase activity
VGSFKANRFGLYDVGSNAWQWCEDWYDKREDARVARGGSWEDGDSDHLLSSFRGGFLPEDRYDNDLFSAL